MRKHSRRDQRKKEDGGGYLWEALRKRVRGIRSRENGIKYARIVCLVKSLSENQRSPHYTALYNPAN